MSENESSSQEHYNPPHHVLCCQFVVNDNYVMCVFAFFGNCLVDESFEIMLNCFDILVMVYMHSNTYQFPGISFNAIVDGVYLR